MATPNEKLAASLEHLKVLQDNGTVAIKSSELSRTHRERLSKHGFIKEVLRGWYIPRRPEERKGETTSWYMSYWKFCGQYLSDRYGSDYCLSAEQSLLMHSGNRTVPGQLIVKSPTGSGLVTELLFNTSILIMNSPLPQKADLQELDGLWVTNLESSLVYCIPSFFERHPIEARAALQMVKNSSDVLKVLLEGGHTKIAGRLAGAFRNIGRDRIANDIIEGMKAVDYQVRETDPFEAPSPITFDQRERSPYVNRIKLLWHELRPVVIEHFPKPPGLPGNKESFLAEIEELYITDAYHSLSIEKYTVTTELIERVRSGNWDTEGNEEDKKQRDTMAARGYWQAFNAVKESISRILEGENPGIVADGDHGTWYRELFAPSVTVGLIKPADLAGYRSGQVYIADSMHTPLNRDAVRDVMPVLFELLEQEEHAGVRAVLGHFIFVYTHPYMDGNGRMGRFLMNTMLASGGYPWTVIPVEERDRYMNALEQASVHSNIEPFTTFISWLVKAGLDGNPIAKKMET
tara:strand:+ start:70021 stop:71577 length:1557 start_codon:yes stop_codon:yes gene_type:complete